MTGMTREEVVDALSGEPHPGLLLGAIVVIGLLALYCHYHPDCAVCQFLEAYN